MLLCHMQFIFSKTADGLAGYFTDYEFYDTGIATIPYGSSFLLLSHSDFTPTIYQYNAAEEEWKTLPKNMSKPFSDIPILIDLDMFPVCAEDIA